MNPDYIIILITFIIIIVLITIIYKRTYIIQENFTADEALQNITSLYNNSGTLTVPNIAVAASGKINSPGRLHISPDEILYLLPKSGVIISKNWGGTGTLNVAGDITASANLNVSGNTTVNALTAGTITSPTINTINANVSTANSRAVNVGNQLNSVMLNASANWSPSGFVNLIKAGKYFSSSNSDGYTRNFMFYRAVNATNRDYWYGVAVKIGSQFFLYQMQPGHTNVPNPESNLSNWEYRGNY